VSANSTLQLVTLDYPPYVDNSGRQLTGVAVELVETIFAELNQPIRIQVLPWARALNNVQYGRSDAVFTAFKNEQRETFADYSQQVLFMQNISLITKTGSALRSDIFFESDLSLLSICAVNKVSYGKRMDSLLASGVFRVIFRRNKTEDCAQLVRANRADVWVNNEFGARSILVSQGLEESLMILTPPLEETPSYIAFSKLREHQLLRNKFDAVLEAMKQDGRYDYLIDNYFESLREEYREE
tara:strand:+ start:1835 stop:2560 length:726 start_codon:yes stop_codon:yes gene_type:complete